MAEEYARKWEHIEIAEELADLLRVVQEMGQRLAHESHGELYEEAMALIDCLHQARANMDLIREKLKLT